MKRLTSITLTALLLFSGIISASAQTMDNETTMNPNKGPELEQRKEEPKQEKNNSSSAMDEYKEILYKLDELKQQIHELHMQVNSNKDEIVDLFSKGED
ncbi:hypothetical protein VQL36_13195 [Chengkuizengella sp. SCS-71B]|uniref:hypothetical protein n=1 Tax=Chengkuizengella sp. SCS-71B TaxID=3115290 RepID=UPI0032C219FF